MSPIITFPELYCTLPTAVLSDEVPIYLGHSEAFGAANTIEGLDAVGEIVQLSSRVTDFYVGQVVLTITRGISAGT